MALLGVVALAVAGHAAGGSSQGAAEAEDEDVDRWSTYARFARNGFTYRNGREDQSTKTLKAYDNAELVSHQLQLVAANLGVRQPSRRHYGHHAFMKARLLHQRKRLSEAYACMARHCRPELSICNGDHDCIGSLTYQMNIGYECDDGEYDEEPDLLRPLLRCYADVCTPGAGTLWATRAAALSPNETLQVLELKSIAIREAEAAGVSGLHRNRTFGTYVGAGELTDAELVEMGAGHTVTHLHRVFRRHLPELHDRLKSLALGADTEGEWGAALHGFTLSALKLRVAELIEYNTTKPANFSYQGLGIHRDSGSLITVSVALTDPREFEGGRTSFFSACMVPAEVAAPSPGDAIIWPSWVRHGVSPVTRGVRRILVLEFWEFCSRPAGRVSGRPTEEDKAADCWSEEDDRAEADQPLPKGERQEL